MSQAYKKQYVLKDDGSATPAFSVEDKKPLIHSGSSDALLLRSGFLNQSEQAGCPVSGALQLNGDLATMNEEFLGAFAKAELEKHHLISYRTYDVDPDYRVCVLADQATLLEDFIATYGTILEIEPVLIGSYHSDYTTAEEIEISASGRGYSLHYTLKSVVDRSLCNYCGLCGRICPEKCISEELHFDFATCTFCTDCEKQCPEKAIDLHAIERVSLDIPALIVLG
ncbi:MAG: 4Fe-4S binding protein, partial [Desulfocapsaceae bacterium]